MEQKDDILAIAVFDGVTKQIVLRDTYFCLWNGSVYTAQLLCFMFIELLTLKLDSQSRLTIPEFSG